MRFLGKENVYILSQRFFGGRELEYNLCESEDDSILDNKTYGIELILRSNSINESVKVEDISRDKTEVLNLIDCLSENGVDTIHFRDVIEDYIDDCY